MQLNYKTVKDHIEHKEDLGLRENINKVVGGMQTKA